MDRPTAGVLRVTRTAVVTVVVVALAAVAHVVGGGHVPTGLAAGAVVVAVALAVHLATRRRLGTAAVTALLAGGQLLLHQAFAALDSARSGPLDVEALNAVPMGGLAHAHSLTVGSPPVPVLSPAHAAHASGTVLLDVGPWALTPMLAAHVAATVVTALVLASGERALWRLWVWLSPLVVALLLPCRTVAVALPRAPRAAFERRPVHEVVLARTRSRRGPPVGPVHA